MIVSDMVFSIETQQNVRPQLLTHLVWRTEPVSEAFLCTHPSHVRRAGPGPPSVFSLTGSPLGGRSKMPLMASDLQTV